MESGTLFEFGNESGVTRAFQKGIILGGRTSRTLRKVSVGGWGGVVACWNIVSISLLSSPPLTFTISRDVLREGEREGKREGEREGEREEREGGRERREREGERGEREGEREGERRSSRSEIATI